MQDYQVSNFSFGAILHLAHLARTKRLSDNEILQVMTRCSRVMHVRADVITLLTNQVVAQRTTSK